MKRYIRYPVIMAGAALMGFAVKNIYDPAGIVTGGFAGIAIIAAGLKAVPLWVTNMALNVPLFIMAGFLETSDLEEYRSGFKNTSMLDLDEKNHIQDQIDFIIKKKG